MKARIIFLFTVCLILLSCKEDEDSYIFTNPTHLSITDLGGLETVSIESNMKWTAKSSDSWCTISPTNGDESIKNISVSVSPNDTYADRNSTITIVAGNSSKTINIVQVAPKTLLLTQDKYDLSNDASIIEVEVKDYVKFNVDISDSWIKQTSTSDLPHNKLKFDIAKNESYDNREATITITQKEGAISSVINVYQSQTDAIILSEKAVNISGYKQMIEVELNTNVDFEVIIPGVAKSWIKLLETRGLTNKTLVLDIEQNYSGKNRTTEIYVKDKKSTFQDTLIINQNDDKKKILDNFYSYTSGSSAYFDVYQKLSEKDSLYTHFKIYHQHTTVKNDNLWRIIDGNIVKFDGYEMTPIQKTLTGGENEFVWRSARPGVGDATGGYHGDERIDIDPNSSIAFYADNKAISHANEDIELTACSSFYYHQFSTMHQTGLGASDASKPGYIAIPGNPIDCYHEKKTTFENNGYTTYNKLTWAAKIPVKICYIGLICVTSDISFKGTNEDGDRVIFNNDGDRKLISEKPKIKMENEDSTISIVCDAKVISAPFTPELITYIRDLKLYHKYYCTLLTPPTTKTGDVWETVASLSFTYLK